MGRGFHEETVIMARRWKTKYVHEGKYVARVDVSLVEDETGWSPYLSVDDAYKLDDVRNALCQGDLDAAARYGQIYELRPIGRQ